MVRATSIAPQPIAAFLAAQVRGSETHPGGCAGAATTYSVPFRRDDLAAIRPDLVCAPQLAALIIRKAPTGQDSGHAKGRRGVS